MAYESYHVHKHRASRNVDGRPPVHSCVTPPPTPPAPPAPPAAAQPPAQESRLDQQWRRSCGCLRTSEKLREILKNFPSPPPPTPTFQNTCISAHCQHMYGPFGGSPVGPAGRVGSVIPVASRGQIDSEETRKLIEKLSKEQSAEASKALNSKSWQVVFELVQLVQLSVTATALALYYLIYCYMQLVYYTLRSALYFHNADGPMKVTIGVVTITSLVVGFNLLIRIEKLIGIF